MKAIISSAARITTNRIVHASITTISEFRLYTSRNIMGERTPSSMDTIFITFAAGLFFTLRPARSRTRIIAALMMLATARIRLKSDHVATEPMLNRGT